MPTVGAAYNGGQLEGAGFGQHGSPDLFRLFFEFLPKFVKHFLISISVEPSLAPPSAGPHPPKPYSYRTL
jgi:hypothetical protein